MEDNHPRNIDPRPKRRRSKDNPYTIFTTGAGTHQVRYFVSFHDSEGKYRRLELSYAEYETFNRFELDDLSYLNEIDRHYGDKSDMDDITPDITSQTAMSHLENERLHAALQILTETQRRRVVLYYYCGYTYKQIAELEGCTKMPIKRSIEDALRKLKEFLQ